MRTRRALSRTCLTDCLLAAILVLSAPAHAAPQAEASLSAPAVSPGGTLSYTIAVSWQGDADQYLIAPPQPRLPDNLELISSTFASSVQENFQRMTYVFVLRPVAEGDYSLRPVAVKYWARGDGQERAIETAELSFTARPFSFFRGSRTAVFATAAAGACLLACLAFVVVRKKRRAALSADAQKKTAVPDVAALVQACRQAKLQGDYAGLYESAIALARALGEPEGIKTGELAALLEKSRFGGYRPPPDDVERLLRQLEKSAAAAGTTDEDDYEKYCRKD